MAVAVRVLVVSDTHIPDFARALPAEVLREAGRADLVIHAGDVTGTAVLDLLAAHQPPLVALGNGDGDEVSAWGALPEVHAELDAVRVAVIHDSGPTKGRAGRMRRRFPDADLVIYGHSHIPFDGDGDGGQHLFNPGSPTWKRRQPRPTYGVVTLSEGRIRTRIVEIA